jgi:hypothetical protein
MQMERGAVPRSERMSMNRNIHLWLHGLLAFEATHQCTIPLRNSAPQPIQDEDV